MQNRENKLTPFSRTLSHMANSNGGMLISYVLIAAPENRRTKPRFMSMQQNVNGL